MKFSLYTTFIYFYQLRELKCLSICMLFVLQTVFFYIYIYIGYAVVQLVEALHYKPEGHRLSSRWCHWNFSLT